VQVKLDRAMAAFVEEDRVRRRQEREKRQAEEAAALDALRQGQSEYRNVKDSRHWLMCREAVLLLIDVVVEVCARIMLRCLLVGLLPVHGRRAALVSLYVSPYAFVVRSSCHCHTQAADYLDNPAKYDPVCGRGVPHKQWLELKRQFVTGEISKNRLASEAAAAVASQQEVVQRRGGWGVVVDGRVVGVDVAGAADGGRRGSAAAGVCVCVCVCAPACMSCASCASCACSCPPSSQLSLLPGG
jgi:hypothetical protein